MPLSDIACRTAKPGPKAYKMADGGGMYLEIMPNGSKYWRLKYRFIRVEKRLALGVYPDVALAEAREKREAARKLLAAGIDPSFAKQERKRLIEVHAANTFEAVARDWHTHNIEKWSENHATTVMRRLESDILPDIGKIPIKDITAPRLLKTLQDIENRGASEVARRARQVCGAVFRHAIMTGRADRNPTDDMQGALKPFKRGHFAAFEVKDLPDFLGKLHRNEARLFSQTRFAIELLMLTFVRTGELIKSRWDEFDLDDKTWIIPAERMKMRNAHIVPLSSQVVAILAELKKTNGHRGWVFPSMANPQKHMSNNAILMALDRMGYRGKMTGHGFRALAMSAIKEKLGYRHEVVDRQLAHAHRNQVDAAYDRAQFLNERKKMMQEWADFLGALSSQ